jgi:hypothetical protein
MSPAGECHGREPGLREKGIMRGLTCALFIGALPAAAHAADRADSVFPVAGKILTAVTG